MRRWISIVVLALALPAACGKDSNSKAKNEPRPTPSATPPPVAQPDQPEELEPTPVEPEKPAEKPPGGDDKCVADCVQRNQMKATSPDIIEQDCRRECAASP